ncbi:MAG: RsmE family RNA methyltransferase, partial [Candidatus Eisenbacteria bacterium]|nr:RsmE family RNA methyltransferase [Candidatus Eisenbacteria bacterium]
RVEIPRALDDIVGDPGGRRLIWATPHGGRLPDGDALGAGDGARWLVLIGPEGGWSEEEKQMLAAARALAVSLGPHRLRSETAVVHLLGLLQDRMFWN